MLLTADSLVGLVFGKIKYQNIYNFIISPANYTVLSIPTVIVTLKLHVMLLSKSNYLLNQLDKTGGVDS